MTSVDRELYVWTSIHHRSLPDMVKEHLTINQKVSGVAKPGATQAMFSCVRAVLITVVQLLQYRYSSSQLVEWCLPKLWMAAWCPGKWSTSATPLQKVPGSHLGLSNIFWVGVKNHKQNNSHGQSVVQNFLTVLTTSTVQYYSGIIQYSSLVSCQCHFLTDAVVRMPFLSWQCLTTVL